MSWLRERAVRKPVHGAEMVARYLLNVIDAHRRSAADRATLSLESINGRTGIVVREGPKLVAAVDLVVAAGRVAPIALQVNPNCSRGQAGVTAKIRARLTQTVLRGARRASPQSMQRLLAGRPMRRNGRQLAVEAQLLLRLLRASGADELWTGDVAGSRAALEEARGCSTCGHSLWPPPRSPSPALRARSRPASTPPTSCRRAPRCLSTTTAAGGARHLRTSASLCRYLALTAHVRGSRSIGCPLMGGADPRSGWRLMRATDQRMPFGEGCVRLPG